MAFVLNTTPSPTQGYTAAYDNTPYTWFPPTYLNSGTIRFQRLPSGYYMMSVKYMVPLITALPEPFFPLFYITDIPGVSTSTFKPCSFIGSVFETADATNTRDVSFMFNRTGTGLVEIWWKNSTYGYFLQDGTSSFDVVMIPA